MNKKEITGIILAGGENKRMGTHKAFLDFDGKLLIDIIIDIHMEFCENIIIVTDKKSRFENINDGILIVEDDICHKGPLSGIYYGLINSKSDFNLITSCDLPFLKRELIIYLLNEANIDSDVVIPFINNKYQPLLAVYSKKCIGWIKDSLDNNKLKVTDFFNNVNVKKIEEKDIEKMDKKFNSFININTPDEYKKALLLYLSTKIPS